MRQYDSESRKRLVLLGADVLNIALAILFVPVWQESGMTVAILLSEAFITGAMLMYLSLRRINPLMRSIRDGYHAIVKE
jgi:O-antigen/teichoic acid export membrane protein